MTGPHPDPAAPELAIAMAETAKLRADLASLCREFGPTAQTGWSARLSLTVLNRYRATAGLDRMSRTPSNNGVPATERERDGLRALVRRILQSMPDTADEPEWRDRAGALGVTDPDGEPYRAQTDDDL